MFLRDLGISWQKINRMPMNRLTFSGDWLKMSVLARVTI
jgi:hypothetical protein